ncbi:hypothetical protein L3X38_035355 [Prunus dulcis]|uniref:Uncharacterized protein n=1 Tax=Prunus dulcis TaxID=3755 RepID=A0AAD4VLU8_PRUDU|nr:hypothetical protein L3X38_035355 [Prunus dulcis]
MTNLQTVPCTTSADLPKLSLISIELAGKQADQNLETFRELSHNATAAKMKERFYKEVRPQIQAAHLLSQKRHFKNLCFLKLDTSISVNRYIALAQLNKF